MLDMDQFRVWCLRLKLSERAHRLSNLFDPLTSESRAERSPAALVVLPSRKWEYTIQFESHKVELPTVYEMEHDPDVIEYYDQPPRSSWTTWHEWPATSRIPHSGLLRDSSTNCGMGGMQDGRGAREKSSPQRIKPLLSRRRWNVAMPARRGVRRAVQPLYRGAPIQVYRTGSFSANIQSSKTICVLIYRRAIRRRSSALAVVTLNLVSS